MKPQRLLTKFALLVCIGISAVGGSREGVVAAADWNLFDSHHSEVSHSQVPQLAPAQGSLASLELPGLELSCPYLLPAEVAAAEVAGDDEPSSPAESAAPLPEDRFEYGYDFDYAHPAARYAADAYMQEDADNPAADAGTDTSDETADDDETTDDLDTDDAESGESIDEESFEESGVGNDEPIPMLILEDESDLDDALATLDGLDLESIDDPFLLEDEASLATAIALLDAATETGVSEESAWVAVATETDGADYGDEETLDGQPEEAVHDWLYYDYTYEPDYFESTEAADELYPDTYATEAAAEKTESGGIDTVDDNTVDRDTADDDSEAEDAGAEDDGETAADYPEYYDYDHGMFEYADGADEATANGADADEESADEESADKESADEESADEDADDSAYYDDPMDSYYADADWSDYERTHAAAAEESSYEEAAGERRIADDATDGDLFVKETSEFDGESAMDDEAGDEFESGDAPLPRDDGTWDQGDWDHGTVDEGTVDEGTFEDGTLDLGTVIDGIFEKSEGDDSDDDMPEDRQPSVDNVPADLRRTDEDADPETE